MKSKEPRLDDPKECDHSVAAVETKECNPFTAKDSDATKPEDPKTKDSAVFESSTAMKTEEPKP